MLAPWVKAKAAASIGFDEMYEGNPILGLQFSEKLKSLAQKRFLYRDLWLRL